jgi:hypothetical protein
MDDTPDEDTGNTNTGGNINVGAGDTDADAGTPDADEGTVYADTDVIIAEEEEDTTATEENVKLRDNSPRPTKKHSEKKSVACRKR